MRTRTVAPAALSLIMALSGCTAGPDYHMPETSVALAPGAAFAAGSDAAYSQAPLPDQWWKLYEDSRLDGLVSEALAANTDLRAAEANLRRASALVREAEAARSIETDISASVTGARVGGYTEPLITTSNSYALGLNLSYPLDLAGGIRRGIEAANANAEVAQATRDQVRVVVAAAVTRAFARACSANRTLAATQHVLEVQRQTLAVTEKQANGGRGTAFDVSRARAAASESATAIPTIIADRQTALYELAALMGRLPADYPKELEDCAHPPVVEQPIPIGDGWQLIQRRPDIREAERGLAAATAMIGVETAQLYPQVSIGGAIGLAATFDHFVPSQSFGGSIGPLLSWKMPDRSVARARIAEAGAGAESSLAVFDGTVLKALKQTETTLSACTQEMSRERSLAQARDSAAQASDQANRLFQFGRTGFIDALAAEAALANAESTLALSRAQVADRQIDLFLALGGGWGTSPEGPEQPGTNSQPGTGAALPEAVGRAPAQ
ncbi:efflux transporter outer membrane subunit [Telmatospirillum sp.]|uniref:efflux transporter outer membrane subunit n=1 Tax=Telmatospirillum sp. TaxID=2079197 RepID=UPI00284F7361|nr:efflux transporter outer membrane subunit [Telmatospirillum sp.]MDR3435296.1 efflux transporter outer membrane subunit [Telmatospirillum sp.]